MKLKVYDYFFVFFLLFSIIFYFHFYSLNVDSTWFLHGAKKILSGDSLYSDLPALNPPLMYIYSIIPAYISDFIPLTKETIYIIIVFTLSIVSIFICYKIIILNKEYKVTEIRIYIYCLSIILILGPSYEFGQREHLFMIFIMPYLFISIYRNKIDFSKKFLIIIALFSILGFNLKPHFFLIFVGIELINLINKKSVIRTDSIIIFLSGFLYLLLIKIYFNDYFTTGIPLAIEMYSSTFDKNYISMFINFEFIFLLLSLIYFYFFSNKKFNYSIQIFFSLLITSTLIYILQQKGWLYHRIPFFFVSTIFLVYIFLNYTKKENRVFFLPLIIFFTFIVFNNISTKNNFENLQNLLDTLPSKSKIHIVSVDVAKGQSLLLKKDQIWSSRFAGLIMLAKIINNPKDSKGLKTYLFKALFEDLKKYQPDTIIFIRDVFYTYFINENIKLAEIYKKNYEKKRLNGYIVLIKKSNF